MLRVNSSTNNWRADNRQPQPLMPASCDLSIKINGVKNVPIAQTAVKDNFGLQHNTLNKQISTLIAINTDRMNIAPASACLLQKIAVSCTAEVAAEAEDSQKKCFANAMSVDDSQESFSAMSVDNSQENFSAMSVDNSQENFSAMSVDNSQENFSAMSVDNSQENFSAMSVDNSQENFSAMSVDNSQESLSVFAMDINDSQQ